MAFEFAGKAECSFASKEPAGIRASNRFLGVFKELGKTAISQRMLQQSEDGIQRTGTDIGACFGALNDMI